MSVQSQQYDSTERRAAASGCHGNSSRALLPVDQAATLARLTREVQQLEAAGRKPIGLTAISTGCSAMDACLPSGGYAPGTVVEYLRTTSGCGATYLALTAAAAALRACEDKYLVIVDTHHQLYPPALLCHQIALQRVIWVRPQCQADAVWAADQALRTKAVAAVIADLEVLDERDARRLQLAAERGGGLGLLLRSLAARRMPSWAEVQWVVRSLLPTAKMNRSADPNASSTSLLTPLRRLEVGLARVRGGKAGAQLLLDIDAARGTLELAPRENNHHERLTASRRPAQPAINTSAAQQSTAQQPKSNRRQSAG